jgi:hypothetical protein
VIVARDNTFLPSAEYTAPATGRGTGGGTGGGVDPARLDRRLDEGATLLVRGLDQNRPPPSATT